jgi:hypothetical protein
MPTRKAHARWEGTPEELMGGPCGLLCDGVVAAIG